MDQKHIHNLPDVKIKVSTVNEERKLPSEYSVAPLKGLFISSERQYPVSSFTIPTCYCNELDYVLIPDSDIHIRIEQLAGEVHGAIGDQPLVVICVLKGAFRFFTDLVSALSQKRFHCNTTMTFEFIRAQSYIDTKPGDCVNITGLSNSELLHFNDKHVLIIDDILDTGHTMATLVQKFQQSTKAKRVWTAVLLSKRDIERSNDLPSQFEDFVAFSVPNLFVVGYGMDYNQLFRDLPHVCVMNDSGIAKYRISRDNGI